jgi:hypothetical protein
MMDPRGPDLAPWTEEDDRRYAEFCEDCAAVHAFEDADPSTLDAYARIERALSR